MNLPQALEIVKDHIRISKGMELVNGVPEALEMVVEELAVTQRALELACAELADIEVVPDINDVCPQEKGYCESKDYCRDPDNQNCSKCLKEYFLAQAKSTCETCDVSNECGGVQRECPFKEAGDPHDSSR